MAGAAIADGRRAMEDRRARVERGRKARDWCTAAADRERPGARRGGAATAAATEGEGKEAMVEGWPRGGRIGERENAALYYLFFLDFFNAFVTVK